MIKLKSISLVLAVMLGVSSQSYGSNIEFTYAEGELFGYGQGMKETIDVAMLIDNPSLSGMKLTGFKAYISGIKGIENTSLWISRELKLENKENVPDIASYEVSPVLSEYGGGYLGLLSIELPEPFILDGQPLYLGYSITVADNSTIEEKYPMVLSEGNNPNGFFLHMSKSVLKWMDYSKKAGGVAYIVATLEGDINEYSLGISGYTEANVTVDTDFSVELLVNNNGIQAINEVKYEYSYDSEAEKYEGLSKLPAPLNPEVTTAFPITLEFKGVKTIGPHILHVNISELNGKANMSASSSKDCLVNVMPYTPTHRPLVEEFTGLWCGWCPRGWVGMDMLGENYGKDMVVLCYHNADGMAVTNTYPVEFSGYPNASLNRTALIDPYYGTYNENVDFGIAYDVENSMAEMTYVDLLVDAKMEGSVIDVTSTSIFMKDVTEANYQLGYVLTCNGLSNPEWVQRNYYNGLENEYIGTYLEDITRMPSRISGLIFNDVVVDVSAMSGIEGSLPSDIKTAEEYTHHFSFDIKDNGLIEKTENIVVNVFVIDKNSGAILNANKYAFNDQAGIDSIKEGVEIVSTEYFDLNGLKLKAPGEGILIKRDRLSDGSVRTTKIVKVK